MSLLISVKDVDSAGKTLFWFPQSFSHGITSPFDKILISPASSSMLQDTVEGIRAWLVPFLYSNIFLLVYSLLLTQCWYYVIPASCRALPWLVRLNFLQKLRRELFLLYYLLISNTCLVLASGIYPLIYQTFYRSWDFLLQLCYFLQILLTFQASSPSSMSGGGLG